MNRLKSETDLNVTTEQVATELLSRHFKQQQQKHRQRHSDNEDDDEMKKNKAKMIISYYRFEAHNPSTVNFCLFGYSSSSAKFILFMNKEKNTY